MNEQTSDTKTIGQTLREYREHMQLSIEELAQELYISSEFVERIEADDYLNQGELSVFIRGYYRNYAKVVGYPLQKLDNQLIQAGAMQPRTQTPSQQFEYSSHHRRAHHWWRWLSLIVLIGLITAFVIWFVGDDEQQSQMNYTDVKLQSSPNKQSGLLDNQSHETNTSKISNTS